MAKCCGWEFPEIWERLYIDIIVQTRKLEYECIYIYICTHAYSRLIQVPYSNHATPFVCPVTGELGQVIEQPKNLYF